MQQLENASEKEELKVISLYSSEYLQESMSVIEQHNLYPEEQVPIYNRPQQTVDELIKGWASDLKRK